MPIWKGQGIKINMGSEKSAKGRGRRKREMGKKRKETERKGDDNLLSREGVGAETEHNLLKCGSRQPCPDKD